MGGPPVRAPKKTQLEKDRMKELSKLTYSMNWQQLLEYSNRVGTLKDEWEFKIKLAKKVKRQVH